MSAISVIGLSKSYGPTQVISGLDLEVDEGCVAVVLGPSGSGKTTLLRLIAGFDRPDAGTVSLFGSVVDGPGRFVPPERRRIGYVTQEGDLFPHLSVAGNVGFGLSRKQRRSGRVEEMLELVGMADLARRYPHELSGGQQQRVALARALALDPQVVLLDEPFSSLDANLRVALRIDVMRILRQRGTTTVLVTHDQAEALSIGDQVGIIMDGCIRQFAPPEELYAHPVDVATAQFLGEANILEGISDGKRVATPLGELALASTSGGVVGEAQVLVRPEQLSLSLRREEADASRGARGRVVHREYYGHDCVVVVDVAGLAPVRVRCSGSPEVGIGDQVEVVASGEVMAWPLGRRCGR